MPTIQTYARKSLFSVRIASVEAIALATVLTVNSDSMRRLAGLAKERHRYNQTGQTTKEQRPRGKRQPSAPQAVVSTAGNVAASC